MITAAEALKRLMEGNKQFATSKSIKYEKLDEIRKHTVAGQKPFATIIGCSDSRVPLEIIFNQHIGDLFVIRIAGNVLSTNVIGSVEYSIKYLGINLVMVLGHSNCGLITAALSGEKFSFELKSLIDKVQHSAFNAKSDNGNKLDNASIDNVVRVVDDLEDICERFIANEDERKINVVGGFYNLETGIVDIVKE